MMTAIGRARLENLIAATMLGFLALLIALGSLFADRGAEAREAALIGRLSKAAVIKEIYVSSDPDFDRIFKIEDKGRIRYAAVVRLGSLYSSSLISALLSPEGQILALRFIASTSSRASSSIDTFLVSFLGRDGEKEFPKSRMETQRPDAMSGATLDLICTSATLNRLSSYVSDNARTWVDPKSVSSIRKKD